MVFSAKLSRFVQSINRFNEFIGKTVAWCVLAAVLITFFIVILRYGFNWNSIALQESVMYFHALLFMLGAAYTFKHDGHVRVDIFYRNFSPKAKAVVNIIGALFLLIPLCVFILWVSMPYVIDSWISLEGSRETGGLDFLYLLKSVIPITAILLLLQAISSVLQSIEQLMHQNQSLEGIS